MKAIGLWQPWASLIACGAKRIETRPWSPPDALIGERIAIHATLTAAYLGICLQWPFQRYIADARELPLGAIVATAVLLRCERIDVQMGDFLRRERPDEFAFGDYTPRRFAWILRDVDRLEEPVAFRGRQKFFDVPDDLLPYYPPTQETLL